MMSALRSSGSAQMAGQKGPRRKRSQEKTHALMTNSSTTASKRGVPGNKLGISDYTRGVSGGIRRGVSGNK